MNDLIRKQFKVDAAFLKQLEETGSGTAQIATIGVKDHDGDIMLPGAFTEGQTITIQPSHNWMHVPLGKGTIRIDGIKVLVDFKLNIESASGKEWHSWLKFDLQNGVPIQEWSWGWESNTLKFRLETIDGESVRLFEKVNVIEASPVLRGAGTETGTVAIKTLMGIVDPTHKTGVSDAPWSQKAHASEPSDHHILAVPGAMAGEASIKACLNGIDVLNGKRAGEPVNPDARQSTYDHLASHLKDAGITPAALETNARCGLKFSDEVEAAIQSVYDTQDIITGLKNRIDGLIATRAGDGRELTAAKLAQINEVIESIKGLSLIAVGTQDANITEQAASAFARTEFLGLDPVL